MTANQPTTPERKSRCCNYPVVAVNGKDGTSWYECSGCELPCNIAVLPVNLALEQRMQEIRKWAKEKNNLFAPDRDKLIDFLDQLQVKDGGTK